MKKDIVFDLYVDGSYSRNDPNYVFGGILLLVNNKLVVAKRIVVSNEFCGGSNNVGGELLAAQLGLSSVSILSKDIPKGLSSCVNIYYDYNGINMFTTNSPKRWKAKKSLPKLYVASYTELIKNNPSMEINKIKVKAHTGVKYNEMVDAIAGGKIPEEVEHIYAVVTIQEPKEVTPLE